MVAQQVRTASSSLGRFDAFSAQIERVNNLFSNTETGLSATLQKFANALQDVANSPTSISARQVLLSEARGVAERMKSYDSQLQTLDGQVSSQIGAEVAEISQLADGIAQLNRAISGALASNGQPPNDLMDQRDQMLDQLSTRIEVSTVVQDDGSLNVFVGSGQPLVLGGTAAKLVTVPDAYDPSRQGIALQLAGGNAVDITANLTGGSLGGLLDFREQVLDPTRNSLGRMAIGLADVVNQQHRAGIDLHGRNGTGFLRRRRRQQRLQNRSNTGHRNACRHAHRHRRADGRRLSPALSPPARGPRSARTRASRSRSRARARWRIRCAPTASRSSSPARRRRATASSCSPTRSAAAGMDVLLTDPVTRRGRGADPLGCKHREYRKRHHFRRFRGRCDQPGTCAAR